MKKEIKKFEKLKLNKESISNLGQNSIKGGKAGLTATGDSSCCVQCQGTRTRKG